MDRTAARSVGEDTPVGASIFPRENPPTGCRAHALGAPHSPVELVVRLNVLRARDKPKASMIAATAARRKSLTVDACHFMRLSVPKVVNYAVNS
jgi:hypothetical protein